MSEGQEGGDSAEMPPFICVSTGAIKKKRVVNLDPEKRERKRMVFLCIFSEVKMSMKIHSIDRVSRHIVNVQVIYFKDARYFREKTSQK